MKKRRPDEMWVYLFSEQTLIFNFFYAIQAGKCELNLLFSVNFRVKELLTYQKVDLRIFSTCEKALHQINFCHQNISVETSFMYHIKHSTYYLKKKHILSFKECSQI